MMLRTSWFREITLSVEGVCADQQEDTSVQFLPMAQSWLSWKVESLGGLVGKILLLATLCFLAVLCLFIGLIKVLVWLIGLGIAFPVVFLCAIKFDEEKRLLPM